MGWRGGGGEATGELHLNDWFPVELKVVLHDSVTTITYGVSATLPWTDIIHKTIKMNWQAEEGEQDKTASSVASKQVDKDKGGLPEALGSVWGSNYYHESMGNLLDKYHDCWNAVLIYPGSEIDNMLQEAYHSKRTQPGEQNNDEQSAPQGPDWQ